MMDMQEVRNIEIERDDLKFELRCTQNNLAAALRRAEEAEAREALYADSVDRFWQAKESYDDCSSEYCGCPCEDCLIAMLSPLEEVKSMSGQPAADLLRDREIAEKAREIELNGNVVALMKTPAPGQVKIEFTLFIYDEERFDQMTALTNRLFELLKATLDMHIQPINGISCPRASYERGPKP